LFLKLKDYNTNSFIHKDMIINGRIYQEVFV